jgi:hypothetical protein
MSPIAIDSYPKVAGTLFAVVLAATAVIGGFATATAISSQIERPSLTPVTSLAGLGEMEPDVQGAGDYEVAAYRGNADPVASGPVRFWSEKDSDLKVRDWLRDQLVRLPDGAAAHLNSNVGKTWVVELVRTYETFDGRVCREFSVTALSAIQSNGVTDSACRHGGVAPWDSQILGRL